ncbi:SPOR domain-containing protein [Deinococcus sp. UYEF24]
MNTVKRRWPDLLIGLLVLLLLGGFAALLLGKNRQDAGQSGVVQPAANGQQGTSQAQGTQPSTTPTTQAQTPQAQTTQTQGTQTSTTNSQAPSTRTPAASGSTAASGAQVGTIPTIPSAPLTVPATTAPATSTQSQSTATTLDATTPPATTTAPAATVAPQAGGAVTASASRVPTRNDYRISLGSYADNSAVQAATAGVNKLGYTVYPIAVASGVVAQVGPFATREAAAQALADIQRALPNALLYPPRNAPASDAGSSTNGAASTQNSASNASSSTPATSTPATGSELAASGPVYLQVGAYNSVTAAQTAVGRVRSLGLEPSVNAPTGKLVTVVVGPYQGQALTDAEAKLQSGGIDSFRVR